MLKKSLLMTVGLIVFICGLILFPLPVPFGLPIMIVGAAIMFKSSNRLKRFIIRFSEKNQYTRSAWSKLKDYRRRKKVQISQKTMS